MNYKKTNASKTTISRDVKELSKETDNIYKTISKTDSNNIKHIFKTYERVYVNSNRFMYKS